MLTPKVKMSYAKTEFIWLKNENEPFQLSRPSRGIFESISGGLKSGSRIIANNVLNFVHEFFAISKQIFFCNIVSEYNLEKLILVV